MLLITVEHCIQCCKKKNTKFIYLPVNLYFLLLSQFPDADFLISYGIPPFSSNEIKNCDIFVL